jgi:predicted nucleotidyltransferase
MKFLEFLKKNQNTRKVFGEREMKIIEKQLKGISLTQSEKNRLSRDIRKKFDFIKEAGKFSAEFELKKAAIIKEKIEEAKTAIINDILFAKIKKIILYGSILENKITPNSDIDIAVYFSNIDIKEATYFRKRIQGKVDEQINVQVHNNLPQKIKREIDLKGRVIYIKRGEE